MPETIDNSEGGYDMENSRPLIKGLSPEESVQVYEGDFISVLDRIGAMPEEERARVCLELEGSIGDILHTLALGEEAMAETTGEIDTPTPHPFVASIEKLNSFHDEVLKLYPNI